MAEMEELCARLCLLTRAAWRDGLPAPLARAAVHKMLRLGALHGLALRRVPGIKDETYLRAEALLSRSAEIGALVDAWRIKGYDALLPEYDERLINLWALGVHMPQFIFACGNRTLLSRRSVAVTGSREISEQTAVLARDCGRKLAKEGYVLVSGGAFGVDTWAQRGALESGGSVIIVPAIPAKKLLGQEYLLRALAEGRLLMLCDTWPDEGFTAYKALARNLSIYALGDAALVVAARDNAGGTWNGAAACLKNGCTPLFAVDASGEDFAGNRALIAQGAEPFDIQSPLGEQMFPRKEEKA